MSLIMCGVKTPKWEFENYLIEKNWVFKMCDFYDLESVNTGSLLRNNSMSGQYLYVFRWIVRFP